MGAVAGKVKADKIVGVAVAGLDEVQEHLAGIDLGLPLVFGSETGLQEQLV